MRSPICQYNSTRVALTAWCARRRAASISPMIASKASSRGASGVAVTLLAPRLGSLGSRAIVVLGRSAQQRIGTESRLAQLGHRHHTLAIHERCAIAHLDE